MKYIGKLKGSNRVFIGTILLAACAFMVTACGEDRTHEYEEKTARDHWMLDVMRQEYLWGSSIQELGWKDYFAKPSEFFAKLTKQAPVNDKWSWCAIDTIEEDYHERGYFNHYNSYGLDFVVMIDPTGGTSRQYARILTVYPNSPAERCGLQRGDFISAIDGTKFTSSEAKKLKNGKKHTLTIEHLGINSEEETFVWEESETVELGASEYVEDTPYPVVTTLDVSGKKVGYMLCSRLTEGPVEKDVLSTSYRSLLITKMASMAAVSFDVFVLDLRLCNDGTLSMANLLASYFADESMRDQVFAKTFYNENRSGQNSTIFFDEYGINNRLDVKKLYIVTGTYTQGAPEWIIRALRRHRGEDFVTVVGAKTSGQVVQTGHISSDFYVTLHPAIAYVADADGDYNYTAGLTPDIAVNENAGYKLYPYGSPQELILSTILERE